MTTIEFTTMDSPIGELLLISNGHALTGVHTDADVDRLGDSVERRDDGVLRAAAAQLEAYFAGNRTGFDVPIEPRGTPFQLRVWRALRDIPYGATVGYGELAGRVGNARAARAVGLANARNPIAVIVPCHRVVGADGSLTGYAGGLERKRRLLDLEEPRPPEAWRGRAGRTRAGHDM